MRFGRGVGTQLVDALGARLDTGAGTRRAAVAGITLTGAPAALPDDEDPDPFALPQWARASGVEARSRTVTAEDLRLGTTFHLSGAPGPVAYTAWGRSAVGGLDAETDAVRLDGTLATTVVGADAAWGGVLAGAMLSHSTGEGRYRAAQDSGGGAPGGVESELTGLFPYAARIALAGALGVGARGRGRRARGASPRDGRGARRRALGAGRCARGAGAGARRHRRLGGVDAGRHRCAVGAERDRGRRAGSLRAMGM